MKSTLAARELRLLAVLLLGMLSHPAWSWVYPEHRNLSLLAAQRLSAEHRAVFDRLWQDARVGDEQRLCASGGDSEQGTAPSCIDWAALSAIAGDHSCSSREMLEKARTAPWILQVADVAAQLKEDLARIPVTARPEASESSADVLKDTQRRIESEAVHARRLNALRTADIRLQRADPDYATRAGSNNAHFLLARPDTGLDRSDYAMLALQVGSEISAIGAYAYYHLSALQKASRLARELLDPAQRDTLARSVLADEAFALHFLQDVYAAGHIAGTWGTASQRQGTHDYYNQNGLEVFTWKGGSTSVVLMGDAHMRPEDAEVAASAVRVSLEQVLDVASARAGGAEFPHASQAPTGPETFDVCRNNAIPQRPPGVAFQAEHRPFLAATLAATPVPSLGPGLGSMPRFRSELGRFVGLSGSADLRGVNGGFVASQSNSGMLGGLDLSFRAGFGLDGVTGAAGDGLVYASFGFRSDSPSTNLFDDTSRGSSGGSLSAAIPARTGVAIRLRMPFYILPGDLLLLSPLYITDPEAYTKLAVVAGNGGLFGWQGGWATSIGRFQFILGRELGITYYGLAGDDQLLAPSIEAGGPARVVNFKSTAFDLPIAEYRPYRAFSINQSSSVVFQLFVAADIPRSASTASPAGAPPPSLDTVWSLGLRMVFDWRYYY